MGLLRQTYRSVDAWLDRALARADASTYPVRVAAVLDTFSEDSFRPEVSLFPLHASAWRFQLAACQPHLLFVESAWRGFGDSWRGRVASYRGKSDDTMASLVEECRRRSIPTVFWNKEDPVHFERFIDKARLFDRILTSDANAIERYVATTGRAREHVDSMMFAAQPRLHHPFDATRARSVCFAGSYGEVEFPERRAQLEALLDGSLHHSLVIYDRRIDEPGHAFPERFRHVVRPPMPYDAITREYKKHSVFLNVNTVADSPTMFSRRVFELLASGTPVLSSPSAGMQALFPDLVDVALSADEARVKLDALLHGHDVRARASRGVYAVLREHTYAHRAGRLLEIAGIRTQHGPPQLALLGHVSSGENLARLVESLRAQSVPPAEIVMLVPRELLTPARRGLEGCCPARVAVCSAEERRVERVLEQIRSPHALCITDASLEPTVVESFSLASVFARQRLLAAPLDRDGDFSSAKGVALRAALLPTRQLRLAGWLPGRAPLSSLLSASARGAASLACYTIPMAA